MSSLEDFAEPPKPVRKGTPGKAQPGTRLHPPWLAKLSVQRRLEYGIDIVHLTPDKVWNLLIKTLEVSVPAAVGVLAYDLLQCVEKKRLLRGYSAVAVVGGCLQFASFVLQRPLHYSKERLANTGLKISPHATRCAHNALWWDRDVFEKVVKKRGATLQGLRLPVAQNGGVLKWMLKADVERRSPEFVKAKKDGNGRKVAGKKTISSEQGTFEELEMNGGD
jgi:hypothetical protein